ncbi:MAG TPA: branched-chain amino acid ABC transporter permease [Ktedonobacteraceae bacterium]|jgi:branched-chain amino acid transport system permease protein|nr:branched-chain amino acid ABC transporter permease [Ktedonobacteraceae bacterium]
MALFLQLLVAGLVIGSIYSLISLGYTMVYGIIELINFAHGDIFMIGTLVVLGMFEGVFHLTQASHISGLPLIGILVVTCLVTMLLCAVLGVVIERVAYRPLRNAPRLAPLISAIGVSLILEDIGKFIVGPANASGPDVLPRLHYCIGPMSAAQGCQGMDITNIDILVIVVAVVLMVGLQWLVTRTRIGRAMRAVAQDREAAALMGVNVDRIIAITFFIGAALAGAAAFVFMLSSGVTIFNIGFELGLFAFTAAVLGGIGNIGGAMLGGIVIGLIRAFVTYIPDKDIPFGLPHGGVAWQDAVVFVVLILILVFRPTGLLGQRIADKV